MAKRFLQLSQLCLGLSLSEVPESEPRLVKLSYNQANEIYLDTPWVTMLDTGGQSSASSSQSCGVNGRHG